MRLLRTAYIISENEETDILVTFQIELHIAHLLAAPQMRTVGTNINGPRLFKIHHTLSSSCARDAVDDLATERTLLHSRLILHSLCLFQFCGSYLKLVEDFSVCCIWIQL